MRARIRRCVAVAAPAGVALALPLSAHALEPGVHYDPGTPTAKEYAIPLLAGRADGAGTQDQNAAANTPFGVGIKPPGGGGTGGTGRRGAVGGSGGTGGKASGGRSSRAGGRSGRVANPDFRNRLAHAEEPGGTDSWTLGIALAVVASAALFALVLSRRPEQPLG